jgi:hypothetical protein
VLEELRQLVRADQDRAEALKAEAVAYEERITAAESELRKERKQVSSLVCCC